MPFHTAVFSNRMVNRVVDRYNTRKSLPSRRCSNPWTTIRPKSSVAGTFSRFAWLYFTKYTHLTCLHCDNVIVLSELMRDQYTSLANVSLTNVGYCTRGMFINLVMQITAHVIGPSRYRNLYFTNTKRCCSLKYNRLEKYSMTFAFFDAAIFWFHTQ